MDLAGRIREKPAFAEDRQFQKRLVSFLESPASYPHGPREVRSIQTHISWVFTASPFVFKVKKAVNFGFLDFSSLEKRRHFCQREVELNRRLCPEVYLGVVPIYRTGSDFSFEAEGEIAEYSVKMRELPGGWFLSELLAKKLVGETEINRVISCLHRFYESQTPSPPIEEWGMPEKLKLSTERRSRRLPSRQSAISRAVSTSRMKSYFATEFGNTGFGIAMAICISIISISLRNRQRSSIASSSTIGSASSTSRMISHFWRWISISKGEVIWEICFYKLRRANLEIPKC